MFSRLILKMFGWKVKGSFPNVNKAIVLVAPHTSLFDFVVGRLYFNSIRQRTNFLIKSNYFFFPLGPILKAMGGVPVDKSDKKTNMVTKTVQIFNEREKLFLAITPEGTRSAVKNWKRGFYYIA